jgi:hypothetical protein
VLAVATAAAVSTSANAHYRHRYHACVTAKYDTWLRGCDYCWQPVYEGRAFRLLRPSRGGMLVRNREMRGRALLLGGRHLM